MGACVAHFKNNKHQESLPLSETFKCHLPNHSQKIINDIRNTSNVYEVSSPIAQIKNENILFNNRKRLETMIPTYMIENKKKIKSKEYHINKRVLTWINEIDEDDSLTPPKSMLSLNTLLIRQDEPPQRKTNKQEILEQNLNTHKFSKLLF
ncbi:unnamed protein product [Adineta steineri]|uniref:Uncharacterized protein n=1 Tax=Adineta steineri TaxID=433720 RepID=A0A814V8Z7_9BILA|nr:unnamed protein product [Adineta steineri]CAF3512561.1 unnamed protein product [Adineta steineri]